MIPDKVKAVLEAHGLEALEFESGSTPTAELAAARIARDRPGTVTAHIAKSLLFRSKDGSYFMVVCPGDKRIPSSELKRVAGSKLSMTDPDETERVTGYRPGGVCPFGIEGVQILLDRDLGKYATVYPAAGTDATGVPTTLDELERVTGGRIVDFSA
ncbi:MAG: YbaK/EbsC family protein [Spirochaetaceae bacterium]|nr:YbaK/EbsC family protein [Spirochaetaceae bacterium]